jgi:hypothetical protein
MHGDFLSHDRGGRGRKKGRLPKRNGRRSRRKKRKRENQENIKNSHRELSRKSLEGREEKKKWKAKRILAQRHHKIWALAEKVS